MFAISKREYVYLTFLFIFSFLIRAGVYHWYLEKDQNYWQVDSNTYDLVAQGLADGKGISLPDGKQNFYRLPGYPIFIGFFYKIFGHKPEKVLWAQILLASFIPLLIFLLSLTLFPYRRRLAMLAGAGGAVHLGLILYSGFFMTESLFIFLLLLFFIFFFKSVHLWFCSQRSDLLSARDFETNTIRSDLYFLPDPLAQRDSYGYVYEITGPLNAAQKDVLLHGDSVFQNLLVSGLFLGLASLVRPVGHYLMAVAGLVLLFSNDLWMAKLKKFCLLFFAWLLPVSFWLVRNYLLLGHIFFHTLPGGHFLYLSAARVAMHEQNISYEDSRAMLRNKVVALMQKEEVALNRPLTEIEVSYVHEKLAQHYFASSPLITAKTWITDMMRTCLSLYSAELLYLDAGRQSINYFAKERTLWSVFQRYLMPQTDSKLLKGIIYAEIFVFLFMIFGFCVGLIRLFFSTTVVADCCAWLSCLPFMALFIVIALAGGYARMRLPIEPFLIIFALWGWISSVRGDYV